MDAAPSNPQDVQPSLDELQKQAADNLAGWQRARADYENLKKEWERKQGQFLTDAKEMLLEDILPIYHTFRRALLTAPADAGPWLTGMAHLKTQWDGLLKKWHVEVVPTIGQPFDPARHEAVGERGGHEVVVEEVQGGYLVDGRLLFPARVITGPPASEAPPSALGTGAAP